MANLTRCTVCDSGCQRCNSCQSTCYTCNQCNSCQSCNQNCQVKCNTCQGCNSSQAFCVINTNILSSYCGNSFSWGHCTTGQIMGPGHFDKSVWDKICSFINSRASIGARSSGGSSFSNSSIDAVAPFSANEFNRVANEVNVSTHSPNDIIYGSYFDSLATAANSYRFSSSACDQCNINCDVTCLGCQGCVSCQKCNQRNTDACGAYELCTSCNACLASNQESYCCNCDTCQSDNPKPDPDPKS